METDFYTSQFVIGVVNSLLQQKRAKTNKCEYVNVDVHHFI